MQTHMDTYTTHTHTHTHKYTHTQTHTRIHKHTHTHTQKKKIEYTFLYAHSNSTFNYIPGLPRALPAPRPGSIGGGGETSSSPHQYLAYTPFAPPLLPSDGERPLRPPRFNGSEGRGDGDGSQWDEQSLELQWLEPTIAAPTFAGIFLNNKMGIFSYVFVFRNV